MTQRALNAQLRLIKKGEVITADWLNDVAAAVEKNARLIDEATTEQPEGEDGPGGVPADVIYTETGRTTSTVRIEDASDPNIYVDIERIDTINFSGNDGSTIRLVFVNT